MIENTAKLQKTVKALTNVNGNGGIDILTETGEFRSTYDILLDIAEVWDQINEADPKNQAALLEVLAGKTRGSQLAAILQNPEDLKAAYEMAMDSAGSAMAENEKYLESIQGHIDKFTNSVQTMWMNFIDSDVVKFVVDLGTKVVQLIDKIGVLQSALIGIGTYFVIKKKNNIENMLGLDAVNKATQKVKDFVASGVTDYQKYAKVIKDVSAAKQAEILINSGLSESEQLAILTKNLGSEAAAKQAIAEATLATVHKNVEASMIGELINTGALTTEQGAAAIATIGLVNAKGESVIVSKAEALAKLENAVATGALSVADKDAIVSALGLSAANAATTFSFSALTASVWAAVTAITAFLITNPIGWVILAVGAVVGLVAAVDALTTSHKEYVEQLQETNQEIEELRSNISSLNSELETTKDRIEELENKGPLTLTEQEELDRLREQNAELERQIQLEEAREERARNKQAEQAKGAFESDNDFKAQIGSYTGMYMENKFDQKLDAIEKAKENLDNAEIALQDALNSGMNTESRKFKKLEKNLESAQEDYTEAQSDWDEFIKEKEDEYGSLEWFDGDNLTEAQKTVNEIISSLANYNDRAEIMFGTSGAKESALNRLFGERGSEAGQAFQDAFNAKIEAGEIKVDISEFDDYSAIIDDVTNSVEGLISENPQLKLQLDSLGISAEDVARYFLDIHEAMVQTEETMSITITDITSLTSAYESYVSALQIANEAIFEGQAISEDYYTSLKEYLGDVTVGEEDFSDAIDTTNGYIVKNTKLLKNLISQKKKEQKATVSAAKAQSQLQYTKLVKQLQQAIKAMALDYKAYGYVTEATYQNISALRSQVDAIKTAVREYAILELKLSDVTNAYDEFEEAKNRDAELSYGDSMIEMLQTISDGFLTGKVGSESFKAAVKALVPESVIADCETFEERLDAIDDYFENSKFADYFTIDEDGNFSIAIKNIEAFIEDAKEAGAFLSNADGTFTIADNIQDIEDLADAMGLTKEATVAMVTEFSKYDASWGDIVADLTMTPMDRAIRDTTDALDQAIAKQEQFFKDGKDPYGAGQDEYLAIQNEINNCSDALNNAQKAIIDNTNSWIEASNNVDTAKEKVAQLTKELQELQESGATDAEIQVKTNELQNATKELSEALQIKYNLSEPTQMDFQIVLGDIQGQIDQWKEDNATLVAEVVPKLKQDENGTWKIPAEAEVELSDEDKQKIQTYIDLLNGEQQLELFTSEEIDPVVDEITQVKEVLNNIYKLIESLSPNTDTSGLKEEADKTSNLVDSISPTSSGGNIVKSFFNPNSGVPTSAAASGSSTAESSTSTSFGFDSESIDQQIEAWNTMVDEWADGLEKSIGELKENLVTFFTDTLPKKWGEFWGEVGEKFNDFKEWAKELENSIETFFTETLPEKWDEFWENVGEFFKSIPYAIGYFTGKVSNFFTETLPEKWDEFWKEVGSTLNNLKEDAITLKNKVVEFFTVTIPEKWSQFWGDVDTFITETVPAALSYVWGKVVEFFTVTIPEKWNSFWDAVSEYVSTNITPALTEIWNKVVDFFTVTIPEKWNEFWDGVGTFITETVPTAIEDTKTGVTTFFTETIPGKINELWDGIASWISDKASSFWEFLKSGFTSGYEDASSGKEYGASKVTGNANAKGNAHSNVNAGLKSNEHNSVVGELGPEMIVDPNKGIYYTVGENGTEMVDLPKGAIIYNHKQTEELLKNGQTSRGTIANGGLSFAKGNAHWDYGVYTKKTGTSAPAAWGDGSYKDWSQMGWDLSGAADDLSDAADDLSDAADDFEETFDWIEIRFEELDETLSLLEAKLENAVGASAKNNILDQILNLNDVKMSNYQAALQTYTNKASEALSAVPAEFRDAAQNGAIAITEFVGEADEAVVDAINTYREWAQKIADVNLQIEQLMTDTAERAKEKFDNIVNDYENTISLIEGKIDQLEAYNELTEAKYGSESANIYRAIIAENQNNISKLEAQRRAMQEELNNSVRSGLIEYGSDDWYDAVNAISDVDTQIIELTTDIEKLKDEINEIYWDHFENIMSQIEMVTDEADNLIDILTGKDVVDEAGNWTDEGIAALGLYAQKMDAAKVQAEKYKEQIDYLNNNWEKLGYTQQEYLEKLDELKSAQYDAIKAYNDTKDAIADLTSERVDAIKKGIEKEIDAYEKLIQKKKEALDADKDLHDFQKNVMDQQQEIAAIQRKLEALAADNSASARAQKAQLEAELVEKMAELNETYYDRSISDQQDALDQELDDFTNTKNEEIEGWDEYLTNVETVVADALSVVQANTDTVYQTLKAMGQEYSLDITDSLTSPWKDGANAVQSFSEKFGVAMSSTADALRKLADDYKQIMAEIENYGNTVVNKVNTNASTYTAVKQPTTSSSSNTTTKTTIATPAPSQKQITVGGKINAGSATIYATSTGTGGGKQYFSSDPVYVVLKDYGNFVQVRHHSLSSGVTGYFRKSDVKALAVGTKSLEKSGLVNLDELGEELVIRAKNGRLTYMEKGSGVVPADLTANLMEWGKLDPSSMIEQNRPKITAPHVINNEVTLNVSYGDILHIEEFNGDNPEDIAKLVSKEFEKHTKNLNNALRKYVR